MEILKNLDRTLDEENLKSEILPIVLKKGMDIGSYTKGLTKDEFEIVNEFVINKAKDICEEIYSGNIDIKPYKQGDNKACEYCKYKSVCKFDPKKNKYNNIKDIKNEVFDLMKSENDKKRGED